MPNSNRCVVTIRESPAIENREWGARARLTECLFDCVSCQPSMLRNVGVHPVSEKLSVTGAA